MQVYKLIALKEDTLHGN